MLLLYRLGTNQVLLDQGLPREYRLDWKATHNQWPDTREVNSMSRMPLNLTAVTVLWAFTLNVQAAVPFLDGSSVPGAVVRDSTDAVVGPVVGFESKRPRLLMRNGDERFIAIIKEDSQFANTVTLYFTSNDCSGGAQAAAPFSGTGNAGLYDLQDRIYGFGPGNILYRSTQTTPTTHNISSRYHSINPSASQCQDFNDAAFSGVPMEQVDDLDTLFMSPFRVE